MKKSAPQGYQGGEKLQSAIIKSLEQTVQKQPAKQTREHFDRQEEAGLGRQSTGSVRRDPTPGDHTVQVGMMEQVLAPSMKHAEKPDLRTQMFGVSGDGARGLGRGPEQDTVDVSLVR